MKTFGILMATLAVMPSFVIADDWPQFLGPRRDGVSQEKAIAVTWPDAGPRRLWKRDVGSGYAGPVIAGDRLILFHRVGGKEIIDCLDPVTGADKWTFSYPCDYEDDFGKGNGPRSTPTITMDRVISYGASGILTCLDRATGAKRWQRDLMTDYKVPKSYFGVGSSPVVWNDRVLVNVGAKDAGIVAISLDTGKEMWRATRDPASYSSPIIAEIAGQPRAIFFTREGPVILDPRDGAVSFQKRWRARYDASVNAATPLLLPGDRAFFSTSYETGALLLKVKKDGADVVWTNDEVMSNHYATCVWHDGHLYGCDGRQEAGAKLRCVDPAEPKTLWTKDRFGCAGFVLAASHLLAVTEHGDLVSIAPSPTEYREKARARILQQTPVRAQPALANGILYARDDATLIALDLRRDGDNP